MNAKEKQTKFIKLHLKPFLKSRDYKNSNQTWWKDRGDFYNVINLQNFSWNSKDKIDFIFNLGIALKATLKDRTLKKVTHFDCVTHLGDVAFLPDSKNRRFGSNLGYEIKSETDLDDFMISFFNDFSNYVLPKFEEPSNLKELIDFYKRFEFWGTQLEKQIEINKLI
ncbi:MAG: DUF4304 domain-containing protein [Chryseobacterium sp.]|nr:DUF4304 domain-containing protein [Chryseobacterium sp.]MBP7500726.1 DUF4304 domain-containing protein [Chryseobacterium sp.]